MFSELDKWKPDEEWITVDFRVITICIQLYWSDKDTVLGCARVPLSRPSVYGREHVGLIVGWIQLVSLVTLFIVESASLLTTTS